MWTAVQVFDLIKTKKNIQSDYRLAKELGVTNSLIAKHRTKGFGMSNKLALKCAEMLDYEPELLLLWASIERAKCTEEKAVLERVANWYELARGLAPRAPRSKAGKENYMQKAF